MQITLLFLTKLIKHRCKINENNKQINNTINTKIGDVNVKIDGVKGDLKGLKGDLDGLKGRVDRHDERLDYLQGNIVDHSTRISAVEDGVKLMQKILM